MGTWAKAGKVKKVRNAKSPKVLRRRDFIGGILP
jgi:hypothetical protein